jgi:UDP-glucose 6-dehydrogenase
MYELCDQLNCNYDLVKDTYVNTGKTVDMYLDANEELRGYGGVCLPKDVLSLNYFLKENQLLFQLFEGCA